VWLNDATDNSVTFAFLCSVEVRRRFRSEDPSPLLIPPFSRSFSLFPIWLQETLGTPLWVSRVMMINSTKRNHAILNRERSARSRSRLVLKSHSHGSSAGQPQATAATRVVTHVNQIRSCKVMINQVSYSFLETFVPFSHA
jgi:hypothetical protein